MRAPEEHHGASRLATEAAHAKSRKWLEENWVAMTAWNAHVEEHGLPLAEFRQF
jgi:antitoxin CcdA